VKSRATGCGSLLPSANRSLTRAALKCVGHPLATLAAALCLAACSGDAPKTTAPEAEAVAVLASTEGPTVDRDGNVYFTFGGIAGGRILKWTDGPRRETQPGLPNPPGRVEVFRDYGAGGLIFDAEGRLLACERGPNGDRPGVTRTDVNTRQVAWLAER